MSEQKESYVVVFRTSRKAKAPVLAFGPYTDALQAKRGQLRVSRRLVRNEEVQLIEGDSQYVSLLKSRNQIVAPERMIDTAMPLTLVERLIKPADDFVGHTVMNIRPMTDAEMDAEGWETEWYPAPTVVVLSNGAQFYPSRDEEGNGPGALYAKKADGEPVFIYFRSAEEDSNST